MDPTTSCWEVGRIAHIAVGCDIVELHLHVGIPEPVDPIGHVVKDATIESFIIEVEIVVSGTELPSSPTCCGSTATPSHQEEVFVRLYPFKGSRFLVVMIMLASKKLENLNVSAVIHGCCAKRSGSARASVL